MKPYPTLSRDKRSIATTQLNMLTSGTFHLSSFFIWFKLFDNSIQYISEFSNSRRCKYVGGWVQERTSTLIFSEAVFLYDFMINVLDQDVCQFFFFTLFVRTFMPFFVMTLPTIGHQVLCRLKDISNHLRFFILQIQYGYKVIGIPLQYDNT